MGRGDQLTSNSASKNRKFSALGKGRGHSDRDLVRGAEDMDVRKSVITQ